MFERIHRRAQYIADQRDEKKALGLAELLVRSMNGGQSPSSELLRPMRPFLESWIEAGCRLDKWALRERFESIVWASRRCLTQQESGPVHITSEVVAAATLGGSTDPLMQFLTDQKKRDTLMEQQAAELFLEFVTGPYYDRIGKCPRCQRFFVNMRRSEKTYCSQKCASADTAEKAVRARREQERKERAASVRKAAERFSKLSAERRARLNQRDWIHSQTGLSKKLVTMILVKEGL